MGVFLLTKLNVFLGIPVKVIIAIEETGKAHGTAVQGGLLQVSGGSDTRGRVTPCDGGGFSTAQCAAARGKTCPSARCLKP